MGGQVKTHGALSLFNGVFFAFYESTQISGNLIASLILTKGSYNETYIQDDHKVCGAGKTVMLSSEPSVVSTMYEVFSGCCTAYLRVSRFGLAVRR